MVNPGSEHPNPCAHHGPYIVHYTGGTDLESTLVSFSSVPSTTTSAYSSPTHHIMSFALRLRVRPQWLAPRTLSRAYAARDSAITPEQVSQVAQQEGGTFKGSKSAQLQSEMTKQNNTQGGAQSGTPQAQSFTPPRNITPQQVSEVAQQEGGTTKGSMSAQLQSKMSKQRNNQGGLSDAPRSSSTSGSITPEQVSEVAQQEGGTTKVSESARLQSEMSKQRNAAESSNARQAIPTSL